MDLEEKRLVVARVRFLERPAQWGGTWDGTVIAAEEFGISVREVLDIMQELEDEGV